jgi:hypothetical protein
MQLRMSLTSSCLAGKGTRGSQLDPLTTGEGSTADVLRYAKHPIRQILPCDLY